MSLRWRYADIFIRMSKMTLKYFFEKNTLDELFT